MAKAEFLVLSAQSYQSLGDFRRSLRRYQSARSAYSRLGDKTGVLESSLRLGDVSRQIEMFHDALRWYGAAEALSRRLPAFNSRLDAVCGQAMSFRGQHRYKKALVLLRRVLLAYRRRRDREGEAYALWAIGTTARFAGDLSSAKKHLGLSIRRYVQLKDASGLAYAKCGLGGTLRMLSRPRDSGRLYLQANRVFHREGDAFGIAYSSCGQGNALRMVGDLKKAVVFMNRAISGYLRLGLTGPLAFVLWSRAQLFIMEGNYARASEDLAAAESNFRRSRDPRGLVYVALGRAELARARGGQSAPLYRRSARMADRLELRLEALHARVRLGLASPSDYSRLGVHLPAYLDQRTLP